MKKTFAGVLFYLVAIALLLPAQAAAEKIGFVDVREVIAQSDAGKKAQAEFRKIVEKRQGMLKSKEAALKKDKEAYEKQRPGLTEIAAKEKEMELQKKFREFQRLVSQAEDEMQRKDQELSRKLVPEIYKIINAIGEREGYSLILDTNNPVVIYSYRGSNITAQVIGEFNKVSVKETRKPAKKGKKK